MIRKTSLCLIRLYQIFIFPFYREMVFLRSDCVFSLSCSEYAYRMIGKYGAVKGVVLALRRLLRCHSLNFLPK